MHIQGVGSHRFCESRSQNWHFVNIFSNTQLQFRDRICDLRRKLRRTNYLMIEI